MILRELEQQMYDDDKGFKNKNFLNNFRENIKSYNRGESNRKDVMEFLEDENMDNQLTRNYFQKYGKRFNL